MSHRHQMSFCVRMLEKEYFKNGLNQLEATVSNKLLQYKYYGCVKRDFTLIVLLEINVHICIQGTKIELFVVMRIVGLRCPKPLIT